MPYIVRLDNELIQLGTAVSWLLLRESLPKESDEN